MSETAYTYKIDIDSKSADAAMDRLESRMAALGGGNFTSLSNELAKLTGTAGKSATEIAKAANSVEGLASKASAAAAPVSRMGSAFKSAADVVSSGAKRIHADLDSMGNKFNNMIGPIGRWAGAIGAALGVGSFVQMTSDLTDLNSRLTLVTGSTEAGSLVFGRLGEMATRTYSTIEATTESFLQNAQSLKDLGYSTNESLNYTESLNNALVVSGARAERAASVQNALSKAMASGKLDGDNLNTVIETGGRVASLLAETMGMTTVELRKAGKEGKITGDVMFKALAGNLEKTRAEAEAMPATIMDGLLLIGNAVKAYVYEWDQSAGVSETVAGVMKTLAENIDTVSKVVMIAASAALPALTMALGTYLVGAIKAVTLAIMANPIGFLISVLVAAGVAAWTFRRQIAGAMASVLETIQKVVNGGVFLLNTLIGALNSVTGREIIEPFKPHDYSKEVAGLRAYAEAKDEAADAGTGGIDLNASGPRPDLSDDKKPKKKKSGKSEAEKLAEKLRDYWTGLEEARDAAYLLGGELELHNKSLELSKILSRELTAVEKDRVEALLVETATRKAIAGLQQDAVKLGAEIALQTRENTMLLTTGEEAVSAEMAIQRKLSDYAIKAAEDKVDIHSAEYKLALETYETALRKLTAAEKERDVIKEQNRLLEDQRKIGMDLIEDYARKADPAGWAAKDRASRDGSIITRFAKRPDGVSEADWKKSIEIALDGSAKEFQEAMYDIASEFRNDMLDAIDDISEGIAYIFGTKAGAGAAGLLGAVSGLHQIMSEKDPAKRADAIRAVGANSDAPMARLGTGLSKLTSTVGGLFAEGSKGAKLFKGLGTKFEGAAAGGAIGSGIGAVGEMLGMNRGFGKGAEIGGAVGGMFGPLGSVLGSLGGGLLGSLFHKPKTSNAVITSADGAVSVAGNSMRKETAGLAAGLQSGLQDIAARLGGQANGRFNVSMGTYEGQYRVSTTGQTGEMSFGKKNKSKSSLHDFGSDAAGAIAFAIETAIKQGALTGLSDLASKALSKLGSDGAIALVDAFNAITKEMDAWKDPIGSAVNDLNRGLDSLMKQMQGVGASSTDLAKLEEYRAKKLDDIMKSSTKTLEGLREGLLGEGSGKTALTRLNERLVEFEAMEAAIGRGESIDQDRFATLANDIKGLSGSIYGTSTNQHADIIGRMVAATDDAIAGIRSTFADGSTIAVERQTEVVQNGLNEVSNNVAVTNDLLRQMLEMGGGYGGAYVGDHRVRNQQMIF